MNHIPDTGKMVSDTPRTDAWKRVNDPIEDLHIFARQLERELNEANKTISLQHELMTTAEKRGVDKAKEELNEAKDRINRLEEAGDAMLNAWLMPEDSMEYCDWIALSADAKAKWYKAKEAKP